MTDFKKLRGNRLLLDLPKKDEGKLIVDENTKEALEREMMQKLNKLTVHAVGAKHRIFYSRDRLNAKGIFLGDLKSGTDLLGNVDLGRRSKS